MTLGPVISAETAQFEYTQNPKKIQGAGSSFRSPQTCASSTFEQKKTFGTNTEGFLITG